MNTCHNDMGTEAVAEHRGSQRSRVLLLGFISGGLVMMGIVVGLIVWALTGPLAPMIGYGESWSKSNLETTRQRGEAIVTAIDTYRNDKGTLPTTLDELVPDYIGQIELPRVGTKQWLYGTSTKYQSYYYLIIISHYKDAPGYYGPISYGYNSIDKKWALEKYEYEF